MEKYPFISVMDILEMSSSHFERKIYSFYYTDLALKDEMGQDE